MTHGRGDQQNSSARVGGIVLEALISMALLSLVLGLAAQTSSAMVRQRKTLSTRHIQHAAKTNLMAYAMALPFSQVSTEELERVTLDLPSLPSNLHWQVNVQETRTTVNSEETTAKRISIAVRAPTVDVAAPVSPLVAWRYPVPAAAISVEQKP